MNVSTAYANCERLARTTAANFYPAFLVLPREQRRAMYALYAFNRLTDDISDGPGAPTSKRQALADWQATLDRVLDDHEQHPYLAALRDATNRFGISRDHFHAVIEGCRADLEPRTFVHFADLEDYCKLVASSVGQACIAIWGYRSRHAPEYADAAGIALQLTNILRDLDEDRRRGRVYLPLEDLDRFGCDHAVICADPSDGAFQALMHFEAERAKQYYQTAARLDATLSSPGRAVFRVILGTYRSLLQRIEDSQFDVLRQRITVPLRHKLGLVARSLPLRWGWASV